MIESKGLFACLLLTLIFTILASAKTTFYPATATEITYSGRRYENNQTVKYDWPCFRIAFCFRESTKVVWQVKDTWNYYSVILDGNQSVKTKPGRSSSVTVF